MSFFDFFANLPRELWQDSNENSKTGASEFEQESERFWGKFAVIVSLAGAIVYGIWKWPT